MDRVIVLGVDGRHVTLGRHVDQADIDAAVEAMVAANEAGWICAMGGEYYGRGAMALAAMRTIGAGGDFAAAQAAFEARRAAVGV